MHTCTTHCLHNRHARTCPHSAPLVVPVSVYLTSVLTNHTIESAVPDSPRLSEMCWSSNGSGSARGLHPLRWSANRLHNLNSAGQKQTLAVRPSNHFSCLKLFNCDLHKGQLRPLFQAQIFQGSPGEVQDLCNTSVWFNNFTAEGGVPESSATL